MKIPKIKIARKQPAPTPRRRLSDGDSRPQARPESAPVSFRRNSTITGSHSRVVRSANELDGQLRSPRSQAHHLRRRQRSLSALFAGTMLAIVGIVILLQQFTAGVSSSVYGQIGAVSDTRLAEYNRAVQDYFNARPLQRLRAVIDQPTLVGYLQQAGFRELASIESVVPDGFGKTHIRFKVREPIASWTIDSNKQYVDRNGIIFAYNYFDEPAVKIVDQSGIDVDQTTSSVTSSRFLVFVGQAVGWLHDADIDVRQVIIPSTGTRQVEFALANKDIIKMTVDRPVGAQSEDAARAIKYLAKQRRAIKYVDVRVSGQAYYQ